MRIISRTPQSDDWENGCRGPVRVALLLRDGTVCDLKTYVGGSWRTHRGGVDLGTVPAADATREDREQAVFALSQLRTDEAIPALIDVARMHRDPLVRRRALFWLGQKDDGRAVDLFEEILRGR